jgi:enoyl-CoA hydratase/carnithine racemase
MTRELTPTRKLAPGVDLTIDGPIATITLNIPERHNSLDNDNLTQFLAHLETVEQDNAVRVLVITGNGEKTFCAGAALNQLGSGNFDGDRFTQVPDKISAMKIPTICAFNGSAYGGGTEIGVACDFRIGMTTMRLFVPPARIGLCYPVNGIERYVNTLGLPTAKRLLIASEDFRGPELKEIGYLTHLVEPNELEATTQKLAQRMAGYAPLAMSAMKQICNQVADGSFAREEAQKLAEVCTASDDLKEGFAASAEKRAPVFKGK